MVNENMKISQRGIDFIKGFEGLRLEAYTDGAGVWTIGYGHTQGVYPGMVITEEEALTYLEEDIDSHTEGIFNFITVPLNQSQFDALASFHFNLGVYILEGSELLELINNENWTAAAEEMKTYNKVNGEVDPGIVRRREEEVEMFLSELESPSDPPTIRKRKKLAPIVLGYNSFGRVNQKNGITIHQTGNPAPGAHAQMHAKLQIDKVENMDKEDDYDKDVSSWHWQVDDYEAVQSFEHDVSCFHALDGTGDGNMHTIAIEGCINSDGNYTEAVENMAKLTALIMEQESLTISDVYQHNYWARDNKDCPAQIRAGQEGIKWERFLEMVQEFSGVEGELPDNGGSDPEPGTDTGIESKYTESGIFTPNDTILVRDMPSINGNHVATYSSGESVTYHTVHIGNGYVWLQYLRENGQQGYIPCREYNNGTFGELWGTIDDISSDSPTQTGIIRKYVESGIFTPDDTILVRDIPSTTGNHIATYLSGESVLYHTVQIGNGYVWLQYLRGNGQQGYIPCREYDGNFGVLWGTISDAPSGKPVHTGIIKQYAESGVFTPNDTIFVRDIPSTSGNHISTYVSGESLTYHTIHMGNGYVWLQYSRGNGQQGYIPCREVNEELGELWGTISDREAGNSEIPGIIRQYTEYGVFTPNDTILVRDIPNASGNHVATYLSGESLIYHTVHIGNGYVWLEYLGESGQKRYIPCRTYDGSFGELWGTINE